MTGYHTRWVRPPGPAEDPERIAIREALAFGKAVYDHIKRTITLTEGPPRVWQGSNVGTADTIVIHLDENSVAFGDRVQFTIKPSEQMKEKEK